MIVFRENISKEALEKFREKIDKKKLEGYLKVYDLKVRKKIFEVLKR